MNIKDFYCKTHKNHFKHVCISCIDDIFHVGFDIPERHTSILQADYSWDDTHEFIESLKIKI